MHVHAHGLSGPVKHTSRQVRPDVTYALVKGGCFFAIRTYVQFGGQSKGHCVWTAHEAGFP